MFDVVRNNKKVVQVFLLLITLPFAFWGVDSYVRNMSGGDELATVGGSSIGQAEFQQALREQQERMRAALGANFNPAMMETAEARRAVLENLVNQRLLTLDLAKKHVTVSDQRVRDTIASISAFQDNGQFSLPRYEAVLKAQGMTQAVFEARLRQDLALQQVIGVVAEGVLVSRKSAEGVYSVQQEERQVSEVRLGGASYVASVKLSEDAERKFYEANRKRFELPAQIRAEYVVLNQDELASQLVPSDADLRKEYDGHPERFRQGEERRASHILIQADKAAGEAALKAARDKAEGLLKRIKANPGEFAKLAKENSQDPGSAAKGGDLGYFSRGAMVKPLEDAVFALDKEGDLSGVVQSDFGFHIIRLGGVKAEKVRAFEEVKSEIAAELKRTEAAKKFAELVDGFSNTVYEQADSLKPAAEKFKLQVRTSDWLVRDGKMAPPFDNPKLAAALFSDDSIKNKRNTEAVDVGGGAMVAARVVEFKPSSVRSFEEVKADIAKALINEEAGKLAEEDGAAKLAKLVKGESLELVWNAPHALQRGGAQDLPPDAVRAVFRAPVDKLPSYVGARLPGAGYAIFRIEKVSRPTVAESDPRLDALRQQYSRILAEQDFSAYVAALRKRYDVKINTAALEPAKEKQ